jgi:hypothetical protein
MPEVIEERTVRGRKRRRRLAKEHVQTNLWEDTNRAINSMVASSNGRLKRAELIRELVDEAVRARHLKAVGHDESLYAVVKAQTGVVSDGIAPLVSLLKEEKIYVETSMAHMQTEYVEIMERLLRIENAFGVVIKGFDCIVQNIILIRALIWSYIFEFYFTVLNSIGQKLTREQLRKNYEARVRDIKIEAAKERTLFGEVVLERTFSKVAENMYAEARNPPSASTQNPVTT